MCIGGKKTNHLDFMKPQLSWSPCLPAPRGYMCLFVFFSLSLSAWAELTVGSRPRPTHLTTISCHHLKHYLRLEHRSSRRWMIVLQTLVILPAHVLSILWFDFPSWTCDLPTVWACVSLGEKTRASVRELPCDSLELDFFPFTVYIVHRCCK